MQQWISNGKREIDDQQESSSIHLRLQQEGFMELGMVMVAIVVYIFSLVLMARTFTILYDSGNG